ncbi:hypothetical protein ACEQ8H_000247 [Pleosporales sp. CAS-2024a]
MPLELQICQEHDLPSFVRIQLSAFSAGGGMTTLLKPDPLPADWGEKALQRHLTSLREERDVVFLKVIDTELRDDDGQSQMIAGAKWRVNTKERSEEQVRATLPRPGKDDEGRPAAVEFYRFLARVRWEYMGTKPFYFLHILVTDPVHHRRGAGAMLIRWGTQQADEARLPCFLESTVVGKPLYLRHGFEPQYEEHWDLTKYGLQGADCTTVMIRPAASHVH